jgi:hypothetical protein
MTTDYGPQSDILDVIFEDEPRVVANSSSREVRLGDVDVSFDYVPLVSSTPDIVSFYKRAPTTVSRGTQTDDHLGPFDDGRGYMR